MRIVYTVEDMDRFGIMWKRSIYATPVRTDADPVGLRLGPQMGAQRGSSLAGNETVPNTSIKPIGFFVAMALIKVPSHDEGLVNDANVVV